MRHWRRYVALAVALVLVVVAVRIVYVARHRGAPNGAISLTPGPVLITPGTSPNPTAAPSTLYLVDAGTMTKWAKSNLGEITTIRAIQGIVNRRAPAIFILFDHGPLHDQDWLSLLKRNYRASLVEKSDSAHRTDQLSWFIQTYRSQFTGYVLFDAKSSNAGGPSGNIALSLAGVLNAIPIDRNDESIIQAARNAGLTELADVTDRDYAWLRASQYWSMFSRDAVYFSDGTGLRESADYAVARRMAAFWDDVRSDPQMTTMDSMLSDQNPGGIVFGWGYTDAQYREDVFVAVASRHNQSVMDIPPNLSVYMHYPLQQPLANQAPPALPTRTGVHYVAFLYSDGDNPRVIFNELTQPGNDRYASKYRGTIPVGWTVPPAIADLAGPIVTQIYATATPNDVFLAGPSGYGYTFPSLIPDKHFYAGQTKKAMARLGLRTVEVLDTSGGAGFSHSALDPITAQSNVAGVFFTAFNGRGQPPFGTVLWSNGKPVLPTVTLQRQAGQQGNAVLERAVAGLNALPRDTSSPTGYTIVYVDFWSISMTDLHQIASKLDPNVVVVRPDVLTALAQSNIPH